MFDEIQEKKRKQNPYRIKSNSNSKSKRVDSSVISRIDLNHETHAGYSVFLSCVEVFNDQVFDLLRYADSSAQSELAGVKVKEKLVAGDLNEIERTQVEVCSMKEAMQLIHEANSRRASQFVDNQPQYTRSHFIIDVNLVKIECPRQDQQAIKRGLSSFKVNRLCIVDLVGCSRLKQDESSSIESGYIKNSLLALRNCFETVKANALFPAYRDVLF
jgi:hypothetical protein